MGWPLLPSGASTPVTYGSRLRYVDAVAATLAAQVAQGTAHIRRGLCTTFPERALRLCGWRDLQRLVCGEDDIDLELLKRNTDFDSRGVYSWEHDNIKNFWAVMAEFSPEQKRNFIR